MKIFGLTPALWFASLGLACAQVTVEVALDQEQFLPNEALAVAVRITNLSGQSLQLGADAAWLTFSVESSENRVILKTGEVPVAGEFKLDSAKRAIKRVDVSPYFNLTQPGHYTLTATVKLKEWNQQITSPPKPLDIIAGTQLWEQEFGVPGQSAQGARTPEIRKYTLQQANYLRKQLMLYFRLTDPAGRLNKVYPIGPMISFGQPEPVVDRASRLHVLYQNGPHSFNYTVFTPDGELVVRQSYDFTSRPRLRTDTNSVVSVVGGTRRPTSRDLPAPAAGVESPKVPGPAAAP